MPNKSSSTISNSQFLTQILSINPYMQNLAICIIKFHPVCIILVLKVIHFCLYDILTFLCIDAA